MKISFYIAIPLIFVSAITWIVFSHLSQNTSGQQGGSRNHAYLQMHGSCLQLSVADTSAERRQGLSDRQALPAKEGMLFTYDQPGKYGFWMKNMNFPIDIVWLDKNETVVTVKEAVSPNSFPKTFYPAKPAKNVIEIASGTARRQKIKSGDKLKLLWPTTTRPEGC